MAATGKLTKSYLEREYKQAILSFKGAISENEQWQARKEMANLERCAAEMYGFQYADELHELTKELTNGTNKPF
jgi:hypothetical protein